MNDISIITIEPGDPRPASQGHDLLALLSVSVDAFPPALREIEAAADFVSEMMARAVIVECRTPEGLAGAVSFYANDAKTRRGFITFVAVDPPFRGFGIARQLIVAALAYLKAAGFSSVWLKVRADNPAARRLYLSCGFNAVAESAGEIEMTRRVS